MFRPAWINARLARIDWYCGLSGEISVGAVFLTVPCGVERYPESGELEEEAAELLNARKETGRRGVMVWLGWVRGGWTRRVLERDEM